MNNQDTITREDELARKLSMAGDSTRLKILVLMFDWEKGCVSSVAEAIDTSVATASYHLNLMVNWAMTVYHQLIIHDLLMLRRVAPGCRKTHGVSAWKSTEPTAFIRTRF